MPRQLPTACRDLAEFQSGVITRQQAMASGLDSDTIGRLLRNGRWQLLQRGVYLVVTGEPPRSAVLWGALARAGRGAALSHQTAAELFGLTDQPSSLIHVTIPVNRRVGLVPGVAIHRSSRVREACHPSLLPPRTRIEETIFDLVQQAASFDAAFNIACAACQRRLTTTDRLAATMTKRNRLRWRTELGSALTDIGAGVHSLLEYRYVHRVERPHGLPRAVRQVRIVRGGRSSYLDNLYPDYHLCVELDGRVAHPEGQRWRDIHRDNAGLVDGLGTLRFGWRDIEERACLTAVQVGTVLSRGGWRGELRRCGPGCLVGVGSIP